MGVCVVMYLSCHCICIFELAISCSERTITFVFYSKVVVRLPCRVTSPSNSRCCFAAGEQFNVKFSITPNIYLSCSLLWLPVVMYGISCGFLELLHVDVSFSKRDNFTLP